MLKKLFSLFLVVIFTLSFNIAYASEEAYVNCNLLNVRVSPTTSSDVVTQLPYGSKFEIVYTEIGWYNIKMQNGVTGFVSAPYVVKSDSMLQNSNSIGENVAADAYKYLGYNYVYGTAGPYTFDCSGFTSYLYKQYGVTLPRVSTSQGEAGVYVEKSLLMPGDIVCFSNRSDRKINHVGIYVGDGDFIHASTSSRGVVMDNLNENYYLNHYVTARRVV